MSAWLQKHGDTYLEAPYDFNNTSNFTGSPEMMKSCGFDEYYICYKKDDCSKHYFLVSEGDYDPDVYTETQPSNDTQVWNGTCWEDSLEIAKSKMIREIYAASDAEAQAVKAGFSASELETWAKQEKGAYDLSENPQANTREAMFVKNLAEARGIPLEQLIQKILYCVTLADREAVRILGKQQALEDRVKLAGSLQELYTITWA